MEDLILTPEERRIIEERRKTPPIGLLEALIRDGIIDEQGKVLVRMPYLDSDFEPEGGPVDDPEAVRRAP